MKAETIESYRTVFSAGKRGEVVKAGNELIAEIERLQKRKKPKQAHLFAPTIDEMLAYAKTIEMDVQEATAFYDHHEARGWKYKPGLPMIDWKAAMRTWHRNRTRFLPGNGTGVGAKPTISRRFAIG